jgi:Tfp pilus assembly protein PilX
MRKQLRNNGSVMLMVVFAVAMLSALVMGMLQINTEEIQLMQNQINAAHALATAEAGLNDAFFEIRGDATWNKGFKDKSFNGGLYNVTVDGGTITSIGTTAAGFIAEVEADIITGGGGPYVIKIEKLRINE